MAGISGGRGRRLLAAAIAASFLGVAAPRPAAAAEPNAPTAVAVFAPRASASLRGVDAGARIWVVQELRRGGIPVVDLGHTDAMAARRLGPAHLFLTGADTPALARETEARAVLLSRLEVGGGQVEIWIRAYDRDGAVIAAGHGTGRTAALGEALVAALDPVRKALGADPVPGEAAPRLSELGSYERALGRLSAGSLAPAWRELEALRSPTADALREDILARSATPATPGAERSRLASLRGASDPDWLAIRRALHQERTVEVLLAGAQKASSAGDAKGALVLFGEAAEADAGSVDAERGRAQALVALGRHPEAAAAWERVRKLAPGDLEATLALAANPSLEARARAQLWLAAGALQSQSLDDAGARASFERAAELDPALRAGARQQVGQLEETLGNDADALLAYDEALAIDGSHVGALHGVGRVRARGGDAAAAASAFEQVLAQRPDDPAALAGLGEALVAQGQPAEAVPALERAVALAPQEPAPRSALARAFASTGREDDALRVLEAKEVLLADRPRLLAAQAEIHSHAGRPAAAQAALEQAVAIEPDDAPLRSALAKVYQQAGHPEEAARERAFVASLSGTREVATEDRVGEDVARQAGLASGEDFAALAASFPSATPGRIPIRRVAWLGLEPVQDWQATLRAWLLPRSLDEAKLALALQAAFAGRYEVEAAPPVPLEAQTALANLRAFGTERADVALLNDLLASDALLVARYAAADEERLWDAPGGPIAIELRLASGRSTDAVWMVGNLAALSATDAYLRWNPRAAGVYAALLALLLVPLVRGWGALVVVLDYERTRGSQGFFSIELSRRPGRTRTERKGATARSRVARYQRRARPWARFSRHMVGRETRLRWLPARQWYVAVHGLLQDVNSQEVIGNYLEERKVKLTRGETTKVVFDFRRKAAPIEVRLFVGDGEPVPQGRVAVLGVPDSLRFAKEGGTTLFLPQGKYTVLIGVEDRVFERPLEVQELVGQTLSVAADRTDEAVFTGCKEAADAYLQGDLPAASRTLERTGKHEAAALIRAAHHRLRGEAGEAARWLEKAGRFGEAALLSQQEPEPRRSAELFEKAGDFQHAAEEHARAGDPLEAARAYEAAFDYGAAIDAYRAAGEIEKTLELLEKTGRFFEAGTLTMEQGDSDRALRNLQQVGARDPEYPEACDGLAKLFEERRAYDLAVEKAREALGSRGADDAPLESHESLALLLERAGRGEEALAVWEHIRKRDFHYAGAADKVETLRHSVAATQRAAEELAASAHGAVTQPARTSRYEILGEVGRGGMGVVLKARDTRLGRVVALKRMPENLKNNPTAVKLFLREARAAAALSHPNIVTLFDADQEADGSYYLTMELLEGFALDSVLEKRGKLSARDAVRVGVQIAKGLQFAHEKGVVHRDIKTANLFFTRERVVKIMDFGLAKMSEEVRRSATVIGGTPYYMAPEQAVGDAVDHRADLYALGVTLFELVTGSVPFREGDVTHHHRHTPAPDPRSLEPDVPAPLAELILALMEKAPEQRPATTAEVVRRLEQMLGQLGSTSLSGPAASG